VLGYRDDGVVLRTQKLGEADRIITLLTRQNGRVRAVAKGVRRTKSRFGGRLEPFTHVDVMIHPGRSLDVITQAEVIRPYGAPLAGDYPRYTAGTAMLETAERFTPIEKEPALRQFLLLIGGLRALGETGEDAKEPRLVLDAYLLRSLAVAGYAPALEECARCGAPGIPATSATSASIRSTATPTPEPSTPTPEPSTPSNEASGPQPSHDEVSEAHTSPGGRRLVAFAVAAGGMVCASCRPPGAASPSAQTVALMLALLRGDWEHAMRSERRHRVECSGLVAAYLQWHLEHSIRSLRHVERA
jgi:DNA repair protein RecO (recombination protein O)